VPDVRITNGRTAQVATVPAGLRVATVGTDTVISGVIADQPALHGLLNRIRDLGLCLISVHRTG
jgi:hypothetical protein